MTLRAALVLASMSLAGAAHAVDYPVGGTVQSLVKPGLRIELSYCLPDGASFTITSTEVMDCNSPSQINKCCSVSIRSRAATGPNQVTCTCGFPIIGNALPKVDTVPLKAAQSLTIPPGAQTFQFPNAVPNGSTYTAGIVANATQPCTLLQGTGTVNGGPVTSLRIRCELRVFANSFE